MISSLKRTVPHVPCLSMVNNEGVDNVIEMTLNQHFHSSLATNHVNMSIFDKVIDSRFRGHSNGDLGAPRSNWLIRSPRPLTFKCRLPKTLDVRSSRRVT